MKHEPLLYNNRPMKAEPINISLTEIVDALRAGEPVVANLEPGDGTFYSLLLVPLTPARIATALGRHGVPAKLADRYLYVGKFLDNTGALIPFGEGAPLEFDLEELTANPWSRTFLAWWLQIIGGAMGGYDVDPIPAQGLGAADGVAAEDDEPPVVTFMKEDR